MTKYLIQTRAGAEFGPYDAESPAGALDAMAREAGYKDAGTMADATGAAPSWTTNEALFRTEAEFDILVTKGA